ncbi:hypothetical protein [Silanimonas sp.]|uniref:hypothetical protein n=1 Tax=Silanimonas sp. TaxID=1929290 RepID=UPI0022BED6BA|nr:hypothetical protein [Silanimonas sp.]MCZ8166069.1 hypothetical protein [Silanimonas sp.]
MASPRLDGDLFPAHGRVEVHPHGRVVYFEATGPFNAEAVAVMRTAYTPIMASMAADGPFGHISTFHESMLATPEAFTTFAALIADWKAMGILPTASAYVVGPDVEGKTIVEAHYRRAWEGALLEIFEQRDEAEAWIARALAGTP